MEIVYKLTVDEVKRACAEYVINHSNPPVTPTSSNVTLTNSGAGHTVGAVTIQNKDTAKKPDVFPEGLILDDEEEEDYSDD